MVGYSLIFRTRLARLAFFVGEVRALRTLGGSVSWCVLAAFLLLWGVHRWRSVMISAGCSVIMCARVACFCVRLGLNSMCSRRVVFFCIRAIILQPSHR